MMAHTINHNELKIIPPALVIHHRHLLAASKALKMIILQAKAKVSHPHHLHVVNRVKMRILPANKEVAIHHLATNKVIKVKTLLANKVEGFLPHLRHALNKAKLLPDRGNFRLLRASRHRRTCHRLAQCPLHHQDSHLHPLQAKVREDLILLKV
jgi:hypothetical protein